LTATPTANSPQSAPTDTPPETRHPALPEQDLQKDHRLREDRRKAVLRRIICVEARSVMPLVDDHLDKCTDCHSKFEVLRTAVRST
jgi:hypothetical protein